MFWLRCSGFFLLNLKTNKSLLTLEPQHSRRFDRSNFHLLRLSRSDTPAQCHSAWTARSPATTWRSSSCLWLSFWFHCVWSGCTSSNRSRLEESGRLSKRVKTRWSSSPMSSWRLCERSSHNRQSLLTNLILKPAQEFKRSSMEASIRRPRNSGCTPLPTQHRLLCSLPRSASASQSLSRSSLLSLFYCSPLFKLLGKASFRTERVGKLMVQ